MIVCPTCGETHLTGTLFCLECGTYLVDRGSGRPLPEALPIREPGSAFGIDAGDTPGLDHAKPVQAEHESVAPHHRQPSRPSTVADRLADHPPQLKLLISTTQRLTTFSLAHEIIIGRMDAKRGVHPDLDLSPDGGLDAGVSRLHAAIRRQNSDIVIIDLSSSNGTLVNGVELLPNVPQPLRDGDEIELGSLRLSVYIGD